MKTNNTNNHINSIEVVGVVESELRYSHRFNNTDYYSAILDVQRVHGKSDKINIFVGGDDSQYSSLKVGSKVLVKGQLVQSFLKGARNISVLVEELEDITDIGIVLNSGKMVGTVLKSYDLVGLTDLSKSVKTILVRCKPEDSERSVTLKCSLWNGLAKFVHSNYEEGDTISIQYRLESKPKDTPTGEVHVVEAVVTAVYK